MKRGNSRNPPTGHTYRLANSWCALPNQQDRKQCCPGKTQQVKCDAKLATAFHLRSAANCRAAARVAKFRTSGEAPHTTPGFEFLVTRRSRSVGAAAWQQGHKTLTRQYRERCRQPHR